MILEGEGFNLEMRYNPRSVTPKIEYNEITDGGLKRYWKSITRIVFTVNHPKKKGKNEIVVVPVQ